MRHRFEVIVDADTAQQAETVMIERLDYDEDYGFEYRVSWGRQGSPDLPEWLWPDPDQEGWWVDAWNGLYNDLNMALHDGAGGVGQEWILQPGESIVSEEEKERRIERHRWGQENK